MELNIKAVNASLIAFCVLMLTACGGGSSSNASSSVRSSTQSSALSISSQESVSSQSSNSSEMASSSSSEEQHQLVLKGLVTDGVITNALVTVWVGETQYNVTANALGEYEITVLVNNLQLDELVYIEAKGQGAQAQVHLVSQLSSFRDLLTQAGNDQILDSHENIRLNITNFSTAQTVLLMRGRDKLLDVSDYKMALTNVPGYEALQLAALLKIIIDNPSYDLPSGVEDTLSFASDAEMVQRYRDDHGLNNGTLLGDTISAMRLDKNLLPNMDFPIIGTYWLGNPDQYSSKAMLLRFDEQGSGYIANELGGTDMIWSRDGDSIQIEVPGGLLTTSTDTIEDIHGKWAVKKIVLNLVAGDEQSNTVEYVADMEFVGEAPLEQVHTMSNFSFFNLISTEKSILPDTERLVGEWQSSLNWGRLETYVFNQDGTGTLKSSQNELEFPFAWTIENKAIHLNFSVEGLNERKIYLVVNLDVGYQVVVEDEYGFVKDGIFIKNQEVSLSEGDLLGRMGGIGSRFENSGNSFHTLFANNLLTYNYSRMVQSWQLNSDGTFSLLNYGLNCISESCPLNDRIDFQVIAQDPVRKILYSVYHFSLYDAQQVAFWDMKMMLALKQELKVTRFGDWIADSTFVQQGESEPITLSFANIYSSQLAINGVPESYSIQDGKIYLPESDRLITLISAGENELTVCFSGVLETCTESELITLTRVDSQN